MRKLLLLALAVLVFFISSNDALASIVTVRSDGEVLVNVLSVQDGDLEIPKSESLEISEIAGASEKESASIALAKDQDKVKLTVDSNGSTRTLDVTNIDESVIELEERPETEKLAILVDNDKFVLKQDNLTAVTDYEIKVNPEIAGITLTTPSGFRFLSIFPKEAVATILRAKIMNEVGDSIELSEGSDGVLSYLVSGERVINFFDLYEHRIPVKARVSASTAEVLSVEQPEWLRILGFLFV